MFQLYSRRCAYTLRALMHVNPQKPEEHFSIKELCRKAKVPEAYTRKAFQALTRAGFLKAVSGPNGGYVLTRHPCRISLLDIILTVEGDDVFDQCVMGLPQCDSRKPCLVHGIWIESKKKLLSSLKDKTLHEILTSK